MKFENLRLQVKGSENQNVAVNGEFMAVPWTSSGGGSVAIF